MKPSDLNPELAAKLARLSGAYGLTTAAELPGAAHYPASVEAFVARDVYDLARSSLFEHARACGMAAKFVEDVQNLLALLAETPSSLRTRTHAVQLRAALKLVSHGVLTLRENRCLFPPAVEGGAK